MENLEDQLLEELLAGGKILARQWNGNIWMVLVKNSPARKVQTGFTYTQYDTSEAQAVFKAVRNSNGTKPEVLQAYQEDYQWSLKSKG